MNRYTVEVSGNRSDRGHSLIKSYRIDADSYYLDGNNKMLSFYIDNNTIREDYLGNFYVGLTWEEIEDEETIDEIDLE